MPYPHKDAADSKSASVVFGNAYTYVGKPRRLVILDVAADITTSNV